MARGTAFFSLFITSAAAAAAPAWVSVVGDPGMRAELPSTAWTGWTFCNYAQAPASYPDSPSPRLADCVLDSAGTNAVQPSDNNLSPGIPFPNPQFPAPSDVNHYAREKELYLGHLCAKPFAPGTPGAAPGANYSHWSVMFKSGNMNVAAGLCPKTNSTGGTAAGLNHGTRARTFPAWMPAEERLQFDNLPMNQPLMAHMVSTQNQPVPYGGASWVGFFAGTYDVDPAWTPAQSAAVQDALTSYTQAWMAFRIQEIAAAEPGAAVAAPARPVPPPLLANSSYMFTTWYRNVTSGSWVYYSALVTTPTYPWLMNYLRSNNVGPEGYGGYPWQGAGMLSAPLPSTGSTLVARLQGLDDGAAFYFPEISGCWKLDGSPCDGDPNTDVTRYICFNMANASSSSCSRTNINGCPPVHYAVNGTAIARTDTAHYPYECYKGFCPPWGCDPYSNPNPQALMMLLPCAEWGVHGFPTTPGEGWMDGSRRWTLDVGGLAARVYFDGAEPPAPPDFDQRIAALSADRYGGGPLPPFPGWTRSWISVDIGPEHNVARGPMMRWEVSEWDVQVLTSK